MSANRIFEVLNRQGAPRSAAVRLGGLATICVLAGAVLAVAGLELLGQLVGGIALVPLALSIFCFMLPAWSGPDDDGGGGWPKDDRPTGPAPSDDPDLAVDWAGFEREFWSYVERRELELV